MRRKCMLFPPQTKKKKNKLWDSDTIDLIKMKNIDICNITNTQLYANQLALIQTVQAFGQVRSW